MSNEESVVSMILQHLRKYEFPVTKGEAERWYNLERDLLYLYYRKGKETSSNQLKVNRNEEVSS